MRTLRLVGLALVILSVGLGILLQGCALSTDKLTYWTDYYRLKMNVKVDSVEFVESRIPCGKADNACACTIRMFSPEGFDHTHRIIYSTDGSCGLLTTEKRLARWELCRIRMATFAFPETADRDTEECMEWYE
jgi:hypothetical protein